MGKLVEPPLSQQHHLMSNFLEHLRHHEPAHGELFVLVAAFRVVEMSHHGAAGDELVDGVGCFGEDFATGGD